MTSKQYSSILFLILTASFSMLTFGQSTIGIPVQGIARDVNGTARINTQIDLTFDLYYIEGGNEVALYTPSQIETVTTDSFGVFSSIVNTSGRRSVFGSREVFLRIVESGTIISDEKLNSVPYAIAADNGVPVGAIMPYVGTSAPEGWLLCDGASIPAGEQYDALRDLYGSTTPDLRGLFLRGAGNNSIVPTLNAPLNTYHGDTFASHNHSFSGSSGSAGAHSHSTYMSQQQTTYGVGGGGNANIRAVSYDGQAPQFVGDIQALTNGAHTHSISGSIGNSGGGETRPDHYSVNYIIKL